MNQKLTKRLCESVKPDPQKRITIKDTEVPGLRLKVSAAGRKTFLLYYRVKASKGNPQLVSSRQWR